MNCKTYHTKTGKEIRLWHGDCMELLESGREWDLAIVDPPYGIGVTNTNPQSINNYKGKTLEGGRVNVIRNNYYKKRWDNNIPSQRFFDAIFDNSDNQIVWGGNYFNLPPTRGICIWNKMNKLPTYADGELAWTSFDRPLKICNYLWDGFKQGQSIGINAKIHGNHNVKEQRIHPTQKPVKLYRWLLQNYATEGDTILDTHGGSMSLAIACYIEDYELDIIELDEDYYKDAVKRFEQHISQKTLF